MSDALKTDTNSKNEDEILNLREENNILRHKNIELSYKIKKTKKKLNVKEESLRTLQSRKIFRVYRKGLRILGRDI